MTRESIIAREEGPLEAVEMTEQRGIMMLEQLSAACHATDSIGQLKWIRDHAEAIRGFFKAATRNLEFQNKAAETRLRAERKAGGQLAALRLRGGDRRSRSTAHHLNPLKLGSLGVTRAQSQVWQRIAAIPEPRFEEYFAHCREKNRVMTDTGLLRWTSFLDRAENEMVPEVADLGLDRAGRELRKLVVAGKRFACVCVIPAWPEPRNCGRDAGVAARLRTYREQLGMLPVADVPPRDVTCTFGRPPNTCGTR